MPTLQGPLHLLLLSCRSTKPFCPHYQLTNRENGGDEENTTCSRVSRGTEAHYPMHSPRHRQLLGTTVTRATPPTAGSEAHLSALLKNANCDRRRTPSSEPNQTQKRRTSGKSGLLVLAGGQIYKIHYLQGRGQGSAWRCTPVEVAPGEHRPR